MKRKPNILVAATLIAVTGIAATAAFSIPVKADDNGVAGALHELRREGRKLCQSSHFHAGTSAGEASKKSAMAQAIDAWQGFTAFEYGTDWAYYRNASSKKVKCEKGLSGWGCDIEARPCKKR
mgnify:CR=1 FL=1